MYKLRILIIFIIFACVSFGFAEDRADRHFEKGRQYCRENDFLSGILEYRESIKIDPKHAGAHNNLGIVYLQNGFSNDLIDELEKDLKSLTELKEYYHVVNALTIISRERKKVKEECPPCVQGLEAVLAVSAFHLEKAKKIAPGLPQPWFNLGIVYHRQEKYDKALDNMLGVEKIFNKDKDYLYQLACTYAMLDKEDKALNTLEKAIENGFDNRLLLDISSDFKGLRKKKAFKKLLSKLSGKIL